MSRSRTRVHRRTATAAAATIIAGALVGLQSGSAAQLHVSAAPLQLWDLDAVIDALPRFPAGVDVSACGPLEQYDAILVGTPGDDVLGRLGPEGRGRQLIIGLGGDDLLIGGWDDDCLIGSEGNDKLYGGQHDDVLVGGAGLDLLHGGSGTDLFLGDPDQPDFCLGIVPAELPLATACGPKGKVDKNAHEPLGTETDEPTAAVPSTPEAPETPETPEGPETPDPPETPESPEPAPSGPPQDEPPSPEVDTAPESPPASTAGSEPVGEPVNP